MPIVVTLASLLDPWARAKWVDRVEAAKGTSLQVHAREPCCLEDGDREGLDPKWCLDVLVFQGLDFTSVREAGSVGYWPKKTAVVYCCGARFRFTAWNDDRVSRPRQPDSRDFEWFESQNEHRLRQAHELAPQNTYARGCGGSTFFS